MQLCTSYNSNTTSIILSSNKIQNGDILVPADTGKSGKMADKNGEREEAIFHTNKIGLMREYLSGVQ